MKKEILLEVFKTTFYIYYLFFSGSGLMEPCDIESIELRLDNYPLPGYPIEYNDGKPTYIIPIKNII